MKGLIQGDMFEEQKTLYLEIKKAITEIHFAIQAYHSYIDRLRQVDAVDIYV